MQCRPKSPERPPSVQTTGIYEPDLLRAVGRSKTDIGFTSVGQDGFREENESCSINASLAFPATRPAPFNRECTILSYTELQIIELAKIDRNMRRIAYKTPSTPEVEADPRCRHFRPDAAVPCWWPDDLLTSTGVELLLSDQRRHQAALYRQLKIDRWRSLVQRKEMELNDRYCLPERLVGAARSDCYYLTKRCESTSPRIFCPPLSIAPKLCMRFLRRHSVRTQLSFVDAVAQKRAEENKSTAGEYNRGNEAGSHDDRHWSSAKMPRTARSAPVCCGF
ncbi:hypothetical protein LSAT2_032137 [Lamellibrachia satsuma]|nr:hypothetical protein LSAT2_032137 [Lamellibrachia satsuma]